jgi:hypothetical protein
MHNGPTMRSLPTASGLVIGVYWIAKRRRIHFRSRIPAAIQYMAQFESSSGDESFSSKVPEEPCTVL